ncbi:glutathione peroxidase [bacterium]|nr:glutathione peroxidase [bacterium]
MTNPLSIKMKDINGREVDLAQYQGKVVLAVNTASACGFTPQYKNLEEIHQKYKGKGLVVLGFPSNDFGAQEPGSNEEVKSFCEKNFGVTFQLFSKTSVKEGGDNALFQTLGKTTKQFPAWNFSKYLIDSKGNVTAFKSGAIGPELTDKIEQALQ